MHDVCAKAGSACKSTLLLNLDIEKINHLEHTNGPYHAKIYCQTPFHAKSTVRRKKGGARLWVLYKRLRRQALVCS